MTKNKEFMTLARFSSPDEAQVIKVLLDSMGVDNQIVNDTATMIMPYLENDVRIMVNAKDYDRAREMLDAKFDKSELISGEKK